MELQKVANINLEEEAYLKPISNRGIGFYNLDKNTAQFQFRVSKDDKPLLVSDKNVKGYAFFKANNAKDNQRPTTSGVIDVEFIDPMKGIIGVTVPQWFLKNVVNSQVLGEVYLSLNDVGNKGKDDTVVLGTFTFAVRDSLVNQIESDIKVDYIRMFDDLRTTLELKVQQLQKDIGDTTSLIETIKTIANDSLAKIDKAQADALIAIANALTESTNSITLSKNDAIRSIDSEKDKVISDINTTGSAFTNTFTEKQNEFDAGVDTVKQEIDDKVNQFNTNLQNNGFTTPTDVDNKLNALDWQKYALTTPTGTTKSIENLDLNNIESTITGSGLFYLYTAINGPQKASSNGILNVMYVNQNYIKIYFSPYNENKVFIRTKVGLSGWTDWEEVTPNNTDTGWISFNLINGALSNVAYTDELSTGFKCAYRIITQGSTKRVIVRLNGSNVIHGMTIAQLPVDITPNAQTWSVRVPVDKGSGIITLRPNGELKFYVQKAYRDIWTSDENSYFYGQFEFTV